jgi:hypothetical protein
MNHEINIFLLCLSNMSFSRCTHVMYYYVIAGFWKSMFDMTQLIKISNEMASVFSLDVTS